MADSDLDEIRKARMAELQQQMGGGAPGGAPGGGMEQQQQQQEQMKQQDEMRHSILTQVLDQQARARLNTIALAKPDKAKMMENALIQMARSGQLQGKIGEEQLKSLLERMNTETGMNKKTTVSFDRRRAALDSDSD